MTSIEIIKGCGQCRERNKDVPSNGSMDCMFVQYDKPMTIYLESGQTIEDITQTSCTCPHDEDMTHIQLDFMDERDREISINAMDIVAFCGWKSNPQTSI